MSAGYLYAFQAKSIQSYVLEGGKLVDLAGASALVDDIARSAGDDSLGVILGQLRRGIVELRRAGGAFTLWSDTREDLEAIQAAVSLHVQLAAPGLDFVDVLFRATSVGDALEHMEAELVAARSTPNVAMPTLPPQTLRAPRTGHAAVSRDRVRENVPIDEPTRRKREAADRSAHDRLSNFERSLLARLEGEFRWPVDFNSDGSSKSAGRRTEALFPFRAVDGRAFPNSTIGIVHADGNGIGKAIIALNQAAKTDADAPGLLWDVSRCLTASAEAAATIAILDVLKPEAESRHDALLAARPVVLGGDDITMIVRGDLALAWTVAYLRAFKAETCARFTDLATAMKNSRRSAHADVVARHFAPGFSAGAGIAFVKASQPFDRAYNLAESLARHAKDHAKAAPADGSAPSLVSFHRLTSSVFESYGGPNGILKDQLTLEDERRLTLNPYDADPSPSAFPRTDALQKLAGVVAADDGFPAGQLRKVLSKVTESPATALSDYLRWRAFGLRRPERKQALADFDAAMEILTGNVASEETFFTGDNGQATPLFDVLSLIAASRGDDA